ncbi:MAG: peptidylprolyl isomerase [Polyangiaceae bacterium]|nr:peptidylprolyl isomerase [Polyangiaceae bacterium]
MARARPFAHAVAAAILVTIACKRATPPPPSVADGGADQVLARVGSRTITLGDFEATLEHMDQFDRIRYRAPERRRELLDEMIDVALLADEARDRGYDRDSTTEEALRQVLRDVVLQGVRDKSPAPSAIPEADVRAYYDAHGADFRDPERRRVSAIVTPTERAAISALSAARAAADPAAWGDLVRTRSIDAGAKADVPLDLAGDLGFVNAPGEGEGDRGANPRVPDDVRAAAFEIARVGAVLDRVVKAAAPGGGVRYYVVKLAAKSDAHVRSLEDAERTIRVKLAQDALHARENALLDDLRKQYPVEIDASALAQVRVGDAGR